MQRQLKESSDKILAENLMTSKQDETRMALMDKLTEAEEELEKLKNVREKMSWLQVMQSVSTGLVDVTESKLLCVLMNRKYAKTKEAEMRGREVCMYLCMYGCVYVCMCLWTESMRKRSWSR
jgi:hypothetical protein